MGGGGGKSLSFAELGAESFFDLLPVTFLSQACERSVAARDIASRLDAFSSSVMTGVLLLLGGVEDLFALKGRKKVLARLFIVPPLVVEEAVVVGVVEVVEAAVPDAVEVDAAALAAAVEEVAEEGVLATRLYGR